MCFFIAAMQAWVPCHRCFVLRSLLPRHMLKKPAVNSVGIVTYSPIFRFWLIVFQIYHIDSSASVSSYTICFAACFLCGIPRVKYWTFTTGKYGDLAWWIACNFVMRCLHHAWSSSSCCAVRIRIKVRGSLRFMAVGLFASWRTLHGTLSSISAGLSCPSSFLIHWASLCNTSNSCLFIGYSRLCQQILRDWNIGPAMLLGCHSIECILDHVLQFHCFRRCVKCREAHPTTLTSSIKKGPPGVILELNRGDCTSTLLVFKTFFKRIWNYSRVMKMRKMMMMILITRGPSRRSLSKRKSCSLMKIPANLGCEVHVVSLELPLFLLFRFRIRFFSDQARHLRASPHLPKAELSCSSQALIWLCHWMMCSLTEHDARELFAIEAIFEQLTIQSLDITEAGILRLVSDGCRGILRLVSHGFIETDSTSWCSSTSLVIIMWLGYQSVWL